MSGLEVRGGVSGQTADVDATQRALKVALADDEALAGYVTVSSEVDAGTVTGTRLMRDFEVSKDYRLRVAVDTPVFSEQFPGAAINTAIWFQAVATMTITVAAGLLNLNAAAATASGNAARVQSYRAFTQYGTGTLYAEVMCQFAQLPVANNVTEWGLGIATGTTAPTAGAFFRLFADGTFKACHIDSAGNEQQSAALDFAALVGTSKTRHFIIGIGDDDVSFWIDDVLVALIARAPAAGSPTVTQTLPLLFRTYNSGVVSGAAQVLKIGAVNVTYADLAAPNPWAHIRAGAGDMSYQGHTGGTMGSTNGYTNSLAVGAGGALVNTAGLITTLGGQAAILPTLAAGTDGIVSSYQVPAGTAALPGKSFVCTGIKVSTVVTTVLAGGPVIWEWSIAFGHTAATMVTAEGAGTKAPRRVLVGITSLALNAAVGAKDEFFLPLDGAPIHVAPGEFFATVAKNIGTVTTTGVVVAAIQPIGYWE